MASTLASPRARALLVFTLAIVVRLGYGAAIADTGCLAINADPISDMDTFHRWALRIVDGDWLGRQDFHPYHPWQRAIAPEATWLGWYGPKVFHQDPLYPYFVALVYALAPREPLSVVLLQFLLGAVTAAGVYLLARRLAPERAALLAGGLAAIYGPFLYYESLLLRDTLLVTLTVVFLIAVEAARRAGGPARWGIAGALAGAIYLTKPNVLIFLPCLAAWIFLSRELKRPAPAVGALACGFLLALAPAIARNVAVGAPALRTTTRGPIEFINGNNPYHIGIGWFDGDDARVTGYAREVLSRTGGGLAGTMGTVLSTWRGRYSELIALQFRKLAYFLAPFEMPNNASYAYFRINSPLLRAGLPTFYAVSPLAALGLVVSFGSWRRFMPHYLFLAAGIAGTVAFYVIARFRIPYVPLMLVFAGLGIDRLLADAASGRPRRLVAAGALVLALLALNTATNYPDLDLVRPQDYVIASRAYAARGEGGRAASELDRGVAVFPEFAPLRVFAGRLREEQGDRAGALRNFEAALILEPGSVESREAVQRLAPSEPAVP
ncbi:MAG: glycosyltransferase family 39 protein [Acidobacteria bacterium]|nr:glycosyltransferase family 39 protein [Acidobacteriota bacterium]